MNQQEPLVYHQLNTKYRRCGCQRGWLSGQLYGVQPSRSELRNALQGYHVP